MCPIPPTGQHARMLVIGNGFDLAHGLSTKYTDMLQPLRAWKEAADKNEYLPSYHFLTVEEVHQFSKNPFIQHFQKNSDLKGWTDFEAEIGQIIVAFQPSLNPTVTQLYMLTDSYASFQHEISLWQKGEFRKVWRYLKSHLDELIEYIDLYLTRTSILQFELRQSFKKSALPSFIYQQCYNYLLSFNYTDTYFKIAEMQNSGTGIDVPLNTQYIHGSCTQTDGSISQKQNIVLGIDDRNPDDLDTVYFKKYFQRIQKHTGREYRQWFEQDKDGIIAEIFGHSLDTTDRDILMYLFQNAVYTEIYYLDQADYETKIINLIRLYGSPDAFQKDYYSSKIRLTPIALMERNARSEDS